jgi:hypothetical protein
LSSTGEVFEFADCPVHCSAEDHRLHFPASVLCIQILTVEDKLHATATFADCTRESIKSRSKKWEGESRVESVFRRLNPLSETARASEQSAVASPVKKEFASEPAVIGEIDKQIKYAEEWIAETNAESAPPQDRPALAFGDVDDKEQPPAQGRSIFDDIEE